jgi:hypothetical protein
VFEGRDIQIFMTWRGSKGAGEEARKEHCDLSTVDNLTLSIDIGAEKT